MDFLRIRLLFVFSLFVIVTNAAIAKSGPLLWDMDSLLRVKKAGITSPVFRSWIDRASKYSKSLCPTVMDKGKCWSGDKHNYETVAPYFWPDPNNPDGKYISRDGVVNPEYRLYDRGRIDLLADRCKTLSTAYYLSRDTVFASAWLRDMRRWFIDSSTMMYPQFDFAQIIPTHSKKGAPGGIIEAYVLTDVVDGIMLMDSLNILPKADGRKLKKWFKAFTLWMQKSYDGQLRFRNIDNIGTAYDVLLYSLCIYTNNKSGVSEIEKSFASQRLFQQITPDGRQTEELKRTLPMKYSIYNLAHIIDFCTIAKKRGVDFYGQNKSLIDNAFGFVKDVIDRRDNIQYKDFGNWNSYSDSLKKEIVRLRKLGNESRK